MFFLVNVYLNDKKLKGTFLKHKTTYKVIGLMSGTSLDGIDIAYLETDGDAHIRFIAADMVPYDDADRALLSAVARGDVPLVDVMRAEKVLTEKHAQAVLSFMSAHSLTVDDVDLVGFHGQTIRHLPDEGLTWQLGNASLLSTLTGLQVAADFRRGDMANGGQGAPLVPLFHKALYAEEGKSFGILNVGGVANITLMGADGKIFAGDTGAGCGLMDAYAQTYLNMPFDKNGECAAKGEVHENLIKQAMDTISFFQKSFPKSADRYDFDSLDVSALKPEDALRTLCAFTAAGVADAIGHSNMALDYILVCGGGAENATLMQELALRTGVKVQHIAEKGLRAESLEAECFAWLAVRVITNQHLTSPFTTGCQTPSLGGILTTDPKRV